MKGRLMEPALKDFNGHYRTTMMATKWAWMISLKDCQYLLLHHAPLNRSICILPKSIGVYQNNTYSHHGRISYFGNDLYNQGANHIQHNSHNPCIMVRHSQRVPRLFD